jgi:LPS export ABC transporter permease LptG
MFRERRLYRYVLRELVGPTLLGILVYSFLLLMNELFLIAQQALSRNLPLSMAIKMLVLALPPILTLSIPMSVLLAALVAVGRLSADQEWTAMQAAGRSSRTLAVPLAIYGLLAASTAFLVFAFLVPTAQQRAREINVQITLAGNVAADLRPRQWEVSGNTHILVNEIRAKEKGQLEEVVVIQHEPNRLSLVFAEEADIFLDPNKSGTMIVDFYNWIRHDFELRDVETYNITFGRSIRDMIPPPPYFKQLTEPPPQVATTMRFDTLVEEYSVAAREYSDLLGTKTSEERLAQARSVRATIEIHRRIALPASCLFFAVLGVPLGVRRVRSGKGAGFSISMLVIVVYYVAFTFFEGQAIRQKFPAWLGPWMGNLILVPWIAWAYRGLQRPIRHRVGLLARGYGRMVRLVRGLRARVSSRAARPAELEVAQPEEAFADLAGTSNRYIRRLDRYVGAQYLRILGLSLMSATTLFLLFEVKETLEEIFKRQQPISLAFRYLGYHILERLPEIIPLGCLAGAVVSFSLLSRTGEITAIKANGISLRRIALPVLVLTGLLSIVLFMVGNTVLPTATRKARELDDRIKGRPPVTRGLPPTGNWSFGPKGERLYYYQFYDSLRDEFHALRVLTLDPTHRFVVDHRFAEKAWYREGEGWKLDGGWYIRFASDGKWATDQQTYDGIYTAVLDTPETLAPNTGRTLTRKKTEYGNVLTLSEIDERIADLTERGYDATSLRVAWHSKFSRAVAPFVMVLLGLPFAFLVGRKGSLYGIAVALLLAIGYWAVLSGFNALGLESLLEPVLAVWAPNVLFGLLGAYLLLYVPT